TTAATPASTSGCRSTSRPKTKPTSMRSRTRSRSSTRMPVGSCGNATATSRCQRCNRGRSSRRKRGARPGLRSGSVGRPQLLVIRHGETEWSRLGRHTGSTDIPLNDQGRQEARDAARTLDGWSIARAYTSPLERARETAELVEPACGVVVDADLVEWDYGVYEGRTTPEIREAEPSWSVWTDPMKGGESIAEVGARVDRFLARVFGEVESGNAVAF